MKLLRIILFFITLLLINSMMYGQSPTKTSFALTSPNPIPFRFAWTNNGLWFDSSLRATKYSQIGVDSATIGFDTSGYAYALTKTMIQGWAQQATPDSAYIDSLLNLETLQAVTDNGNITTNPVTIGDPSLVLNGIGRLTVKQDSLNPIITTKPGFLTLNYIGYTGADSISRTITGIAANQIVRADNTAKWGKHSINHPNLQGVSSQVAVASGAVGASPFTAGYYTTISGISTFISDRAALFHGGYGGTGYNYAMGLFFEDIDRGTNNCGIFMTNTNLYPPTGNYGTWDEMGYNSYHAGEYQIGGTSDLGAYQLQVTGKQISTDIDEYASDLTGSFTSRTKIDKGYADATYASISGSANYWSTSGNSITAGTDFLGTTNNTSLRFRTNNTPKVIIDSNGLVGIGTETPTEELEVVKNQNGNTQIKIINTDAGVLARSNMVFDNEGVGGANANFSLNGINYTGIPGWADRFTIQTGTGISGGMLMYAGVGGIQLSTSGTNNPDLHVEVSTGDVGLGTTTPTVKLDVVGAGKFTGNVTGADIISTAIDNGAVTDSLVVHNASDNKFKIVAPLPIMKAQRVTTGSIAGGTTALVTITWTVAFADVNYTATASVEDATATSLSLSEVHIESKTASQIQVRILNNSVGSLTGTLNVIAIHD